MVKIVNIVLSINAIKTEAGRDSDGGQERRDGIESKDAKL